MTESAIKANSTEAQRLYQRGLAAARGGQKRVAAGLLTRSVRLDPQNELAWLWLSGVLDDPQQQAFCLQSVLKLNPQNPHALRGMRVLEERNLLKGAPQAAPGLEAPADEAPRPAQAHGDSWWVGWRRSRHEMGRARLLVWLFPLLLVVLAIVLYESVATVAEERMRALASTAPAVSYSAPPAPALLQPSVEPILEAEPVAVVESLTASYLAAIEPIRANLREATDAYRAETAQPGGASVGYVAAAQRLRATIEQAMANIAELRPPGTLRQAHDDYLKGLQLQLEGLDAVLEFYGGYDVANANRAALRFQQARAYIDRARAGFAAQSQQMAELSAISPHTAR